MNNLFYTVSVLGRKNILKLVFVHKFLSRETPYSGQRKKRGDYVASTITFRYIINPILMEKYVSPKYQLFFPKCYKL